MSKQDSVLDLCHGAQHLHGFLGIEKPELHLCASQQGLLQLLVDLRRRERLTVVVISHDFAGLEELCPRILHLENGVLAATPTAAGGMS